MYATTPAESVHALDIDELDQPNILFLVARGEGDSEVGGEGEGEGNSEVGSRDNCESLGRCGDIQLGSDNSRGGERAGGELLGIGALKIHNDGTGEVKSMRTVKDARGRGVAGAILREIIATARRAGLTALNLETGVEPYFVSARRLYERHGFTVRAPFADYTDDPLSVYYGLSLAH